MSNYRRAMNKIMKEDAEKFIECTFDDFLGTYKLTLFWHVKYEISLYPKQLEALKRVVERALKVGRKIEKRSEK